MSNRAFLATFALLAGFVLSSCGSSHHTVYITTPLNDGVAAFRVDNHHGGLSQLPGSPYPAGLSPASIIAAPSGKFAYVANGGGNDVSLFKILNTTGLVEVLPRTPTQLNPSSLAMDPAGKFLFVTNSASNNVSMFSVDSSTGALSEVTGSPFVVGFNPIFVAVHPSGSFLYVANSAGNTISAFTISSSGLALIPGSPYILTNNINEQSAGPNWITIDPGGHFLFVANLLSNNFSGFTINTTTGALTLINGAPFVAGTSPSSLAFDPTSKYLFVTNLTSNNVSAFFLNGNGVPIQVSGSPYPTGTRPSFIVLDSNGTFLLVGNQGSSSVTTFSINPQSGQLTPWATSGVGSAPTSLFAPK